MLLSTMTMLFTDGKKKKKRKRSNVRNDVLIESPHVKTNDLHRRKQRRRSAVQYLHS